MYWFLIASLVYGIEHDFSLLPWNEPIGKYTTGITNLGKWNPYDNHVLLKTDREKDPIEDKFDISVNSIKCHSFTRGTHQGQACFTVKSIKYLWLDAHDMSAPTPCSLENGCPVTNDCKIAFQWRYVSNHFPDFEWEKLITVNSSTLFTVDEHAAIKCNQEFNVSADASLLAGWRRNYTDNTSVLFTIYHQF
ncbi:hypothetical protein DSO57_1038495 [Entomophthora muscae]|uniref:Uncharacterized protein n=1 Tax=Entomophthora muscae TaxID=34485 RepID=A0ACC2SYN7_9FUNG|nr:hypothetical protein DSO57_1038495 [Entomophthora muscae]